MSMRGDGSTELALLSRVHPDEPATRHSSSRSSPSCPSAARRSEV